MSKEWQHVPLRDVCALITDGSHFSPPTVDAGVPYVTVRDVRDGLIDLDGAARVSPESFDELRRNGCQPLVGDVLFSKDGTVGRVAVVSDPRPFVVLSSLAILRPNPEVVLPAYLGYALQSPEFQDRATGAKTGLAIKRVVLKNLKEMTIALPPLNVQNRIVHLLNLMDDHLASLKVEVEKLQVVRAAALSDLLCARVELPDIFDADASAVS